MIANLSFPHDCGRCVLGSAWPVAQQFFSFGWGKVSGSTILSLTVPVTVPSLRCALLSAKQFSSFGARTGRARQNRFAQAKGKAIAVPLAGSLGRAHHAKGRANDELKGCDSPFLSLQRDLPMASPPAPRLCDEWQSNCFANGQVRSSFAVRAPCAHQRRGNGKVLGQVHRKDGAATGSVSER